MDAHKHTRSWPNWQSGKLFFSRSLAETSENDLHEFIFQESYRVLNAEGIQVIQALAAIGSATNRDNVCYVGGLKPGTFDRGWRQVWRTRLAGYDDLHQLFSLHPMTRDFVLGAMDQHQKAILDARLNNIPIKFVYERLDENGRQMLWSLACFDKAVSSRSWLVASQLDENVFRREADQLLRLALVTLDQQRQLYSLHPQIKAFALDQLDEPTRAEWLARAQAAIPDLKALRRTYFAYLVDKYGWLDFRGILLSRIPPRVQLMSVYVSSRLRIQEREFEARLHRRATIDDNLPNDFETIGIGQLVQKQRRVVVLGDPGSGKTTLLRYLALSLSEGRQSIEQELGINEDLLPILIPLAAYAAAAQREPALTLTDFLARYFAAQGLPELFPLFEEELAQGRCLVLMDGLDEVMSGQRLQMVRTVESFVNRYKQNRFVVTSRIVGYRAAPLTEDWYVITLTDFDLSDIEHFVKVWYQSSQLATFGQSATAGIEAEREARTLLAAIAANPYISVLAANPLLLQVIVVVYQQGLRLPEHRVSLYDSSIRLLLETWNYARSLSEYVVGTSLDSHEATRILSQVALRVHESSATGLISEGDLRSVVTEVITERGDNRIEALQRADEFLRMMHQQSTILMERGAGVYGFVHITFEEYLAACALAGQRASDRDRFVSSHLFDPRWREVILLLLARLSLIEGRRLETNDLLRLMLEIESDDVEQKGTGVLLAAEFLRDQGRREVDLQIRELITTRLEALFQDGSIPLASRLIAGTMLGELGRVPAALSDMIQVPAGPFVIGGNPKANPKVYEDEQPIHEVDLPGFLIRKHLITNLEYKRFLENGGYDAQMFWTQDGWRYRIGMTIGAPEYWDDDLWNRPNHPVVGISWYEAKAYCAWLTEKLHAQGDLSHDEVIRLPTEAEWEKAAKGVWGHRQWPWGDAFDITRANTAESGIGRTTPVGTYPTGASPYGVEDMAGNTWEWCSSLYRLYPYRSDDGRENLDESGQRVLRGGSWGDNHDYARTTFRGKAVPDARFSTIGFRYIRTTTV